MCIHFQNSLAFKDMLKPSDFQQLSAHTCSYHGPQDLSISYIKKLKIPHLAQLHTKSCSLADAVHVSAGGLLQIRPLLLFFLFFLLFHLSFLTLYNQKTRCHTNIQLYIQ